ncbi:MAG: ABC transporter ATP-binding protein [Chloroflexi bacterium]|nr:ABC transporter ATP-binding protein [Chloroflexota bacterium]
MLQTSALAIGFKEGRDGVSTISQGLNLRLNPNELVCLVGPNGVGKSTLLRTLIGLQKPLSGEIRLLGQSLKQFTATQLAKSVSVVLTNPVSAGAMRVGELVALGRYPFTGLFDVLTRNDLDVVDQSLEIVGAMPLKNRYIDELSDGEKQRVMVARALAQEPHLLVLDEPTAFLDLPGRVSMLSLLKELAHKQKKAVLTSTHDLDLALHTADRIWLMNRNGEISEGSPEDLVLNGQFGKTFNQSNVTFNANTGSFNLGRPPHRSIELHASGINLIWTKRALQRAGYEVQPAGSGNEFIVEVDDSTRPVIWRLRYHGKSSEHTSIYSMLLSLESDI